MGIKSGDVFQTNNAGEVVVLEYINCDRIKIKFNKINDAINYFWNYKANEMKKISKTLPEFKELIENYFEFFFNKYYEYRI